MTALAEVDRALLSHIAANFACSGVADHVANVDLVTRAEVLAGWSNRLIETELLHALYHMPADISLDQLRGHVARQVLIDDLPERLSPELLHHLDSLSALIHGVPQPIRSEQTMGQVSSGSDTTAWGANDYAYGNEPTPPHRNRQQRRADRAKARRR